MYDVAIKKSHAIGSYKGQPVYEIQNQKARAKRGSNTRPKDLQSLARTTELLTRLLGKVAKLVLYKRGLIFADSLL